MFCDFKNEQEWLDHRGQWVGASEAAVVIGLSPFQTNTELFDIKTGAKKAPDLRNNERVKKGHDAEEHIRSLFMVDYAEVYGLEYHPYGVYWKEETPFLRATLDGLLTEKETGRKIILEIKNCQPGNASAWKHWETGNVPEYYFIQVLAQMWCADADGAILKGRLRRSNGDVTVRHVYFDRKNHEDDIRYVVKGVTDFWKCVEQNKRPGAILPLL